MNWRLVERSGTVIDEGTVNEDPEELTALSARAREERLAVEVERDDGWAVYVQWWEEA